MTGSEKDAKFDMAALPAGACSSFELVWCGEMSAAAEAAEALERCLGAMDQGEITLGAQHSNGFGRVKLSVRKRCYDMMNKVDRDAWLDDRMEPAKELKLGWARYTVFSVTAEIPSVLIKGSAPARKEEKNIQVHMIENGRPILPGSSLKGAMRAQMERIADFLSFPAQELDDLLGRRAEANDNGLSGKLVWTDATADEATQIALAVTRIRLNRVTAGVIRGSLFTEGPVSGSWSWQILVPKELERGSLLVLYALRDLGLGLYQLGGTQAVGRGMVRKLSARIQCGARTAEFSVDHNTPSLSDPDGLVRTWEAAFGGNVDEN